MADENGKDGSSGFSFFERVCLRTGQWMNERPRPKAFQEHFLRAVAYSWMRASLANRMYAEGLDELAALNPDRGVLLVSNHRSFFDQYAIMLAVWMAGTPWARRLYFPVRSNFFYERPLGLLVNMAVGCGVMYPPIFRDLKRAGENRKAIRFLTEKLAGADVLVGMHPEGARNKDDDPYTLLPARPGVGEVALTARPIVVPVFINGLSNDLLKDIRSNFATGIRQTRPCICVVGKPIDCAELYARPPRPALYKQAGDRFRDAIADLGQREKALRERCLAGQMPDDDAGWIINRQHGLFYTAPGVRPAAPLAADEIAA